MELYKDILVCIVKNKRFSTLNKADIKTNLAELLKTCQDTITVEIPNFEYAEDFIKFAENYSIKSTDNNIFKIIVKE